MQNTEGKKMTSTQEKNNNKDQHTNGVCKHEHILNLKSSL